MNKKLIGYDDKQSQRKTEKLKEKDIESNQRLPRTAHHKDFNTWFSKRLLAELRLPGTQNEAPRLNTDFTKIPPNTLVFLRKEKKNLQ